MTGLAPPYSDPLRVMVVDDTPDLRALLKMALERTGQFQVVVEAGNGAEAIVAAREHTPDVVLLDIAMPLMDGLEALPHVRDHCPEATVVMLSGFGATEMNGKALSAGADGYIQKGQPLATILAQLRTLVARRLPEPPVVPTQPTVAASVDHLDLAPFGFLQVREGRVIRANREAGRLLGDLSVPELSLAVVVPELAEELAERAGRDFTTLLRIGEPRRELTVTVRAAPPDQLVYLQPQSGDEADLLRRAIATAAHEIRNPVSILMGVAETLTLHRDQLAETDRQKMLEVIGRQIALLDSLTADLLAAGQAQHGTLSLQMQQADAVELVRSILDEDFEVVLAPGPRARMLTDPLRFQQMLGNLVSNARKYGMPPFVVRVAARAAEVLIEVEDSGLGVPEDFRPRLFQEYSRAPGTPVRGTGLGLFVVRALAEAQGGSVGYRPRKPHGSVFSLTLPAVPR